MLRGVQVRGRSDVLPRMFRYITSGVTLDWFGLEGSCGLRLLGWCPVFLV